MELFTRLNPQNIIKQTNDGIGDELVWTVEYAVPHCIVTSRKYSDDKIEQWL